MYEEVKYHTRQKHAFLEAYLRVWTQNVAKNHGENSPSLALIDLFAGSGWCKNKDRNEEWPGTAILLARCLSQYPTRHPTTLFLNSYNPNAAKLQAQMGSLKESLAEIQLRGNARITLEQKPLLEALEGAKTSFDANFPSLWVLDPYAAKEIPWSAVEEIANLRGTRYDRRPELFINLMTMDLQENMPHNPHVVSAALGMEEEAWRPLVEALEQSGLNKRQALVEIYGQKLQDLYGRAPHCVEVEGVHGNIVYVLFFCSSKDAGVHMMRKEAIPKFTNWHDQKWKPRAKSIVAGKKVDKKAAEAGQKQQRLDSL